MEVLTTILPAVGQTAGLLVALWYFLEFQKSRDKAQVDAMVQLIGRIESLMEGTRDDVLSAVREQDTRHQQTITTLFGLTRETIQTLGVLSSSIASLSQAVQDQRQAIQELRVMIHKDAIAARIDNEGGKK